MFSSHCSLCLNQFSIFHSSPSVISCTCSRIDFFDKFECNFLINIDGYDIYFTQKTVGGQVYFDLFYNKCRILIQMNYVSLDFSSQQNFLTQLNILKAFQ